MNAVYCPRDRTLLYYLGNESDRLRCREGHIWEWSNYNHVHGYWSLQEVGFTPEPFIPQHRRSVLGTDPTRR